MSNGLDVGQVLESSTVTDGQAPHSSPSTRRPSGIGTQVFMANTAMSSESQAAGLVQNDSGTSSSLVLRLPAVEASVAPAWMLGRERESERL